MGLTEDLKILENKRQLGEITDKEYEQQKGEVCAKYGLEETDSQSTEYVFGGGTSLNPLTFGTSIVGAQEEPRDNDNIDKADEGDSDFVAKEENQLKEAAPMIQDEGGIRFAAFTTLDGKFVDVPWVTGSIEFLSMDEIEFVKDFLQQKLKNCDRESFTKDELQCVIQFLKYQDLSEAFKYGESIRQEAVEVKQKRGKSAWRFLLGMLFIVVAIGFIVTSTTQFSSEETNVTVYVVNAVLAGLFVYSFVTVRRYYVNHKKEIRELGVWKMYNQASWNVQASFYYSLFAISLGSVIGFTELTGDYTNSEQVEFENGLVDDEGAVTTSNNGSLLTSQVFENNENGFKTYLHFESDYDGSFGSMKLSQKGCRYVYSYQLNDCCDITAEFFGSNCGLDSPDKRLRLAPDSRTITVDISGQTFTFYPVF